MKRPQIKCDLAVRRPDQRRILGTPCIVPDKRNPITREVQAGVRLPVRSEGKLHSTRAPRALWKFERSVTDEIPTTADRRISRIVVDLKAECVLLRCSGSRCSSDTAEREWPRNPVQAPSAAIDSRLERAFGDMRAEHTFIGLKTWLPYCRHDFSPRPGAWERDRTRLRTQVRSSEFQRAHPRQDALTCPRAGGHARQRQCA
jgi:hypothetical protein